MIFMLNTTLSLQVLALVAAAFLFSWGLHKSGGGTGVAKFFGFIGTIVALLSLACSLFVATKFWQEGRMMRDGLPPPGVHEMQNAPGMTAPVPEKPAPVKKK